MRIDSRSFSVLIAVGILGIVEVRAQRTAAPIPIYSFEVQGRRPPTREVHMAPTNVRPRVYRMGWVCHPAAVSHGNCAAAVAAVFRERTSCQLAPGSEIQCNVWNAGLSSYECSASFLNCYAKPAARMGRCAQGMEAISIYDLPQEVPGMGPSQPSRIIYGLRKPNGEPLVVCQNPGRSPRVQTTVSPVPPPSRVRDHDDAETVNPN